MHRPILRPPHRVLMGSQLALVRGETCSDWFPRPCRSQVVSFGNSRGQWGLGSRFAQGQNSQHLAWCPRPVSGRLGRKFRLVRGLSRGRRCHLVLCGLAAEGSGRSGLLSACCPLSRAWQALLTPRGPHR